MAIELSTKKTPLTFNLAEYKNVAIYIGGALVLVGVVWGGLMVWGNSITSDRDAAQAAFDDERSKLALLKKQHPDVQMLAMKQELVKSTLATRQNPTAILTLLEKNLLSVAQLDGLTVNGMTAAISGTVPSYRDVARQAATLERVPGVASVKVSSLKQGERFSVPAISFSMELVLTPEIFKEVQ